MTLTYNRAAETLDIDSTLITDFVGNPGIYTIEILVNDSSIFATPTVNPYVASAISPDVVYEVIVKLTTIIGGTIQIDTGCIFAEGTSSTDCNSFFGGMLVYADANKNITSDAVNKVLLNYVLLTKAQECPCKCDEIKEIYTVLQGQVENCDC